MERAIATLNEVKESIINAYVKKTGLTRNKVSKLMSDETWMNAKKAVELGFADEIVFTGQKEPIWEGDGDGKVVSRREKEGFTPRDTCRRSSLTAFVPPRVKSQIPFS